MRYGPNQKYSLEYGWESFSLSSTKKVRGRTFQSKSLKEISNRTQFSQVIRMRLIRSSCTNGTD